MARGFTVGNGAVLATGDPHGALHELYAPHFSPEHQLLRRPARIGLHADGVFHWLEDSFDATTARGEAAPIADLSLRGRGLPFEIWIETFADARLPILARRVEVRNEGDRAHDRRLAFHYDFRFGGASSGATARDAATGGVVHHGGRRALLLNAIGPEGAGVPQVTISGGAGPAGAGVPGECLLGVPIPLGPGGSAMVTTWIAAARSIPEARRLDAEARRLGVRGLLARTRGYWGLWASAGAREEGDLPEETRALYAHALLTLRLAQDAEYDARFLEHRGGNRMFLRRSFQPLPIELEASSHPLERTARWRWLSRLRDGWFPEEQLQDEAGLVHDQWRDHRRDLVADFRRAFGEDPGPLQAIAVMTDTDNTGSQAEAWYGPITLH